MLERLRNELHRIPAWSSRRAVRAAIAAPIAFGLASLILPPGIALFAAFGTVIQLLFVEFTGPNRHARTVFFTFASSALVLLGTFLSANIVAAAVGIAVIAFCLSFAGIASPAITTGTPAALFVLTLAGTVPTDIDGVLPRLGAWGIACACVWVATTVILPAPDTDPLWDTTMAALEKLRRGVASAGAVSRTTALRTALLTIQHQPGAMSWRQRQLLALTERVLQLTEAMDRVAASRSSTFDTVETDLLGTAVIDTQLVLAGDRDAREALRDIHVELENVRERREDVYEGMPSRDDWEAHVTFQAAAAMAEGAARLNDSSAAVAVAPWPVFRSHLHPRSSLFRSSARTAIALGISIAVAHLLGVEHAFWVSFGTLTVLRTNALNTGQSAGRALLGTIAGAIIGEALLIVSPHPISLWVILPIAILVTGLSPGFFPFTVGQASFTVAILLLFGVSAPGSSLGLARVEDLLLGAAVSVLVALFAWPRGAASSFRENLATAYSASADYLRAAVTFAVEGNETGRCVALRRASVAAEQRAEEALRGLLLERGTSFASPAQVVAALTVASSSRDVADWMIDFSRHRRIERGTRVANWAARALEARADHLSSWQHSIADAVRAGNVVPATEAPHERVEVSGNDALPAWVGLQLDALSDSIGGSVPAISALPPR